MPRAPSRARTARGWRGGGEGVARGWRAVARGCEARVTWAPVWVRAWGGSGCGPGRRQPAGGGGVYGGLCGRARAASPSRLSSHRTRRPRSRAGTCTRHRGTRRGRCSCAGMPAARPRRRTRRPRSRGGRRKSRRSSCPYRSSSRGSQGSRAPCRRPRRRSPGRTRTCRRRTCRDPRSWKGTRRASHGCSPAPCSRRRTHICRRRTRRGRCSRSGRWRPPLGRRRPCSPRSTSRPDSCSGRVLRSCAGRSASLPRRCGRCSLDHRGTCRGGTARAASSPWNTRCSSPMPARRSRRSSRSRTGSCCRPGRRPCLSSHCSPPPARRREPCQG